MDEKNHCTAILQVLLLNHFRMRIPGIYREAITYMNTWKLQFY